MEFLLYTGNSIYFTFSVKFYFKLLIYLFCMWFLEIFLYIFIYSYILISAHWALYLNVLTLYIYNGLFPLSLFIDLVYDKIVYIYIYIYICHQQTDCFVVSQLFSVAWHVGRLKLESKPAQIFIDRERERERDGCVFGVIAALVGYLIPSSS